MHSAVDLRADHDLTDIPSIVRGGVKLGLLEAVFVLLVSLVSHLLMNGALQTAHRCDCPARPAVVILLPGPDATRTTGIAGAAALTAAALVTLLIDVTLLRTSGPGHRCTTSAAAATGGTIRSGGWSARSPWMGPDLANQRKGATVSPIGAFDSRWRARWSWQSSPSTSRRRLGPGVRRRLPPRCRPAFIRGWA
jgi:hypothetical protein